MFRRFCTFIDRRGDKKPNDPDDLLMFEPGDADTMPDKAVPDWYFNAAKTCAIPSENYNPDSVDLDPNDTIRVDNAYKGRLITLSFQVDSANSIRCYLFWNGCFIRVTKAEDLKYILRAMFDMKYGKPPNEEFMESDDFKQLLTKFKLNDSTFDAFYREVCTFISLHFSLLIHVHGCCWLATGGEPEMISTNI